MVSLRPIMLGVCIAAAAVAQPADPDVLRPEADPAFKPVLVEARLTAPAVRPGDAVGITLTFRNDGTAPAEDPYVVFLHFEHPEAGCGNIRIHGDHAPAVPATRWLPGKPVTDGPLLFAVPEDAPEGTYHIHVGVYAPSKGGVRLLDLRPGTVAVDAGAPSADELLPTPKTPGAVAESRARLAARFARPLCAIDRPEFRFAVADRTGAFELLDKATGVRWVSDPLNDAFGSVDLRVAGALKSCRLGPFDAVATVDDHILLEQRPLVPGGAPAPARIRVKIAPEANPPGVRFSWEAEPDPGAIVEVEAISLLQGAFQVTDADEGYVAVPYRLGELQFPRQGLPAVSFYRTYDGSASMAMVGAVSNGSALLTAWDHPGVGFETVRTWLDSEWVPGCARIALNLTLRDGARSFTVHPLGAGSYVDIARAYRTIAARNGWLDTWTEKRKRFPGADRMHGAADFKPFVLSRTIPSSRYNTTGKEQTALGYTFAEVADCAEHWSRDLEIDRAMVVLAGWIRWGYDNRHPDVLPAAPECGGNEALAEAARRIRECGYLFGLHDNYQDMYADAESFSEDFLNKDANGVSKKGGNWAGGQAWQVCAVKQVELALRKQNLPEIARLFSPEIYFIDTVFAWPLVTCEDPAHPMTKLDDMAWKSRLCDVAKEHFGLFGSEEGREWAVPHSDYQEGILSHKTDTRLGPHGYGRRHADLVVPLYEMVYGDCVSLYTHQGDRLTQSRPDYFLDCILYAENAVYGFGSHRYFESDRAEATLPVHVDVDDFRQTGPRTFSASYRWQTARALTRDYHTFVHFVHPRGEQEREGIAFQDDHMPDPAPTSWSPGQPASDGPRTITIPDGIRGEVKWYIGAIDPDSRDRVPMGYAGDVRGRHLLGVLTVSEDTIRFQPAVAAPGEDVLARADNGWAARLGPTDRVIKNTYEVLSHLNRVTADSPMTNHGFAAPDASVEFSEFGNVRIVVNRGDVPHTVPATPETGEVVLPKYGFLIVSPTFVAFHATRFAGVDYPDGAMFTLRSLDPDRPISKSPQTRVFHAFGPPTVRFAGTGHDVPREAVVSFAK